MNRTAIAGFAAAFCTLILSLPVAANTIDGVTLTPPQVEPNQIVIITVQKSGPGSCDAELLYGDGQQEPPTPGDSFSLTNPQNVFAHQYANEGTYTIVARGVGTDDPCENGPQSATLTVKSRPVAGQAPESGGLKPVRPKAQRAPSRGDLKPVTPPTPGVDPDRQLVYLPEITTHFFDPALSGGKKVWAEEGILAPGGNLHLVGKGFGATGYIVLSGLTDDDLYLVPNGYSDTLVSGQIPANLGGAPKQRKNVSVRVQNTENQKWSPAYPLQYENPFASRILTLNDPAVTVVDCDRAAGGTVCNNEHPFQTCYNIFSSDQIFMTAAPDPPPTIYGTHELCPLDTVGATNGTDIFEISLDNGWFIHRVVEKTEDHTSDDEDVGFPSVPTGMGVSNATLEFDWSVTPGDTLRYWMRIEALGPIGTEPF